MTPARPGTWEWLRWRMSAAIVIDRPILLSDRMLHKDWDRKCSGKKKIGGRESQGTYSQNELIGGKPPVVK
jgi:hypothetical protein